MIGERRRNRISARLKPSLEPWTCRRGHCAVPGQADDSMTDQASRKPPRQAQLVAATERRRGGSAAALFCCCCCWNSPGTNRPGRACPCVSLHNQIRMHAQLARRSPSAASVGAESAALHGSRVAPHRQGRQAPRHPGTQAPSSARVLSHRSLSCAARAPEAGPA